MDKPIITFYEPFEFIVKCDGQIVSYLDDSQMTESELLEKYAVDYNSFLTKDIRDENGLPMRLESPRHIHALILDYIKTVDTKIELK